MIDNLNEDSLWEVIEALAIEGETPICPCCGEDVESSDIETCPHCNEDVGDMYRDDEFYSPLDMGRTYTLPQKMKDNTLYVERQKGDMLPLGRANKDENMPKRAGICYPNNLHIMIMPDGRIKESRVHIENPELAFCTEAWLDAQFHKRYPKPSLDRCKNCASFSLKKTKELMTAYEYAL